MAADPGIRQTLRLEVSSLTKLPAGDRRPGPTAITRRCPRYESTLPNRLLRQLPTLPCLETAATPSNDRLRSDSFVIERRINKSVLTESLAVAVARLLPQPWPTERTIHRAAPSIRCSGWQGLRPAGRLHGDRVCSPSQWRAVRRSIRLVRTADLGKRSGCGGYPEKAPEQDPEAIASIPATHFFVSGAYRSCDERGCNGSGRIE